MYAVNIVAHRLILHEVLGYALRTSKVECIYVCLFVLCVQCRVGSNFESVVLVCRNDLADFISPSLEVIAEVLCGRCCNDGTLIKLCTGRGGRYLACTAYGRSNAKCIGRYRLECALYVASYYNIAEGILLVVCQAIYINLHCQGIVSGRHAAEVKRIVRDKRRVLGQLRCDTLSHLQFLVAADYYDVKLTTVGAYTTCIERKGLRSKAQGFLRLQSENDSRIVIACLCSLCWLELLTGNVTIRTQAHRRYLFTP